MLSIVTIPNQYAFSQSPVVIQLASDLIGSPNLSVLLKVEVYINDAWFENAPLVCVPNNNGIATFRLERLLHAYTSYFFPSVTGVVTKPLLKYRLNWAESYGTPPATNAYTQSEELYLVRGGLRTEDWNNLNMQKAFLGISPAKFLSTCPPFKIVKPESLEYLYIFATPDAVTMTLNARVVLNNGTENEYLDIASQDIEEACIVRFEAGYSRLTALTDNPDDVLYYVLFITDNSGKRSMDTRTYQFDRSGRPFRQIFYENSVGGFDTLTLTGNFKEGTNHTRQTVSKHIDFDWLSSKNGEFQKGQYQSFMNAYKMTISASTGYKTFEEIRALSDLLHSQNTWEFYQNKLLPISINTSEIEVRERDKQSYEASFSYIHANEYGAVLPDLGTILNLTPAPPLPVGIGDFDGSDFNNSDFDTV